MRDSIKKIAQFMDPVEPATSLRRLLDMHQLELGDGFSEVWRRHNSSAKIEQRFLFLNTFLMDVWSDIGGSKKPAVNDRAPKIGELIRDNYDIALLTEIFEDNVKDKVLSAWSGASNQPSVVEDARTRTGQSSGLVTITKLGAEFLIHKKVHEYEAESGLFEDGLADKGVMFSQIPLGFEESKLELYNTHLDASDAGVRAAQIRELIEFISSTHEDENIIVLAGDFNIDSRSIDYINLRDSLRTIGLQDIWEQRNGTPGYTNLTEDNSLEIGEQICKVDVKNPQFCDDYDVPLPNEFTLSARIDYIFISEPSPMQTYTLDFTRPRRVRHERRANAPERDKIAFLSDHLGLATTLVINQK